MWDTVGIWTQYTAAPVVGEYDSCSKGRTSDPAESDVKMMSYPLELVTLPPFAVVARYENVPETNTGKSVWSVLGTFVCEIVIARL